MRVIEAFDQEVRSATVSPCGRFLAAVAGYELAVADWHTGTVLDRFTSPVPVSQLTFTPDGNWLVFAHAGGVYRMPTGTRAGPVTVQAGAFSGGVAASPDGKKVAATRAGGRQSVNLDFWDAATWRPVTGFTFWSPFTQLGFSPNGEFLAGIGPSSFELRVAVSGGQNGVFRIRYVGDGFLAFARDSQTVVFGWETNLQVMETRAGRIVKAVESPGGAFVGAAFLGGRQLATADGSPVMRVWSTDSWEVRHAYDWGAGGLTCAAATADGLGGVCGTDAGGLVVFDVDD